MNEPNKIELTRTESYEAGYSREEILKKCAAAASAVLMCSSLAACGNTVSGYTETDGNMVVSAVSDSDASAEDEAMTFVGMTELSSSDSSGGDEIYQLDGDVICVPEE